MLFRSDAEYDRKADNGWIAMVQHYFASAWLVNSQQPREFRADAGAAGDRRAVHVPLPADLPGGPLEGVELVAARHDLADLTLETILTLTPERFAAVFRHTAVKRLKLSGLLRNACVVAGNRGDRALVPLLRPLAAQPTPAMVRAHAVWALRQLGDDSGLSALKMTESESVVLAEY